MNSTYNTIAYKVLRQIFRPVNLIQIIWRRFPIGSFRLRMYFDATPRPHFSYCIYQAALAAQQLGHKKISILEFGVAGGNGLIAMEQIVTEIEKEIPIEFEIYGFDTSEGMPGAIDYRDLPYVWQPGFFQMDLDSLKAKLNRSELVIGNVETTIPKFIKEKKHAPIGFISFDLDYYSSTVNAFKIFNAESDSRLPRIFCYFDDIVGFDEELHCEYVGELLAIKEFNQKNSDIKIAPIYGLRNKRWIEAYWNDSIYVLHDLHHPLYTKYIVPDDDRQMPLS